MADVADFNALSESGDSIAEQWPDIVRATQSSAAAAVQAVREGTEPNDILRGFIFGDDTGRNKWRIQVDDSDELSFEENTGTEAVPVWTPRSVMDSGGFDLSGINHDDLAGFVAAEHIDWSVTGAEDIHVDRITSAAVTQHEGDLTVQESQIIDLDHDANKIQGNAIEDALPSDNDILVWDDGTSQWRPEAQADVSGIGNATQIQGRDVDAAAPSDGDVLAWNNSDMEWEPTTLSTAGSLILIQATTIGSPVTSISIELTGGYEQYVLFFRNLIPETDDVELRGTLFQTFPGMGASLAYDYSIAIYSSNEISTTSRRADATTFFPISWAAGGPNGTGISNTASRGGTSGEIWIFSPLSTTRRTAVMCRSVFAKTNSANSTEMAWNHAFSQINNVVETEEIRLTMEADSITAGQYALYGLQE